MFFAMEQFSHVDELGHANMVDVTKKAETSRMAVAEGYILVDEEILHAIRSNSAKKGDVLSVARVAGIMAAKKTSDLIPLCHPLMLTKVQVDFEVQEHCGLPKDPDRPAIYARCLVKNTGKTGVEMEALTGVQVALLTVYDMCKAMRMDMVITDVCLVEKDGGKRGHYEKQ